jgi:hypothetical protein
MPRRYVLDTEGDGGILGEYVGTDEDAIGYYPTSKRGTDGGAQYAPADCVAIVLAETAAYVDHAVREGVPTEDVVRHALALDRELRASRAPLAFGDVLPNGATVVECRDNGDGTGVVLARCPGEQVEYATWALRLDDPRSTVSGHYSRSLANAVEDYGSRC